ncbi:hypothetical protein HDF15_000369 [Granulicella mallensis]|uniref:Uncharacterized protein n=1 Tax=Granulicella mallensis TaxID=940614 RepID=A0A7W8E816_9BACT|nr:hypothetical protein [Granulicella mallensis]
MLADIRMKLFSFQYTHRLLRRSWRSFNVNAPHLVDEMWGIYVSAAPLWAAARAFSL